MKKRHKAIVVIGVGVLIYGLGVALGISFLGGNKSPQYHQPNLANQKPSYMPTESPESVSKWLAEIKPAAGGNEVEEK
ncbi:hypothetical protein KJ742_01090 [Patescibacteria group bacterium]|nr:hypothetical protein [Patescibacteria group bacterium]